jgi:hypothetical protein
MTNKKKPKANSQQPIAIDINKVENIEITYRVGTKLYAIKPKATVSKSDSRINLESCLLLAFDKHEHFLVADGDIIELQEKLDKIQEENES